MVKDNQDNDFNDKKLTNIDSITVNRDPTSVNKVTNKKYMDDELDKNTILRVNQTLKNYLKVSIGNETYNITKYDKISLKIVTEMRSSNIGYPLLPKWRIKILHKTHGAKAGNFPKSTVTSSPTSFSGATTLPSIGAAFMYIETSSNNLGHEKVFVSWERTDIIHINNIAFY